jgi:CDP-paratose 2-epimerase
MEIVIVTGSAGLVGSEAVRFFCEKDFSVIGIDNDMRKVFFGDDASVSWNQKILEEEYPKYKHYDIDIRDQKAVENIYKEYNKDISLIIHCAAQPSHDWAAKEPFTDFTINANGTLNLLENTRNYCPDAVFIFCSTNKVYGDTPNLLPLIELETRWEIDKGHKYYDGIDETMSIDHCKHSLFGASKVAADIMVQEYGKYFGMKTVAFRGGCLTGPAHSGAELHGFLAYVAKCSVQNKKYTIFGYKGKQVRDNIHSNDLIRAFWCFFQKPRVGEVYNIGGSRHSNCSILESIQLIQELTGNEFKYEVSDLSREGDHLWWISDIRKFQSHYPEWSLKYGIQDIIKEIVAALQERQ